MPWLVIHARERELLVSGVKAKRPTFTSDAEQALRFDRADKARQWIAEKTASPFGELALLRAKPSRKKNPAQAGQPGGAIQRNFSDEDSAFSRQAPQDR